VFYLPFLPPTVIPGGKQLSLWDSPVIGTLHREVGFEILNGSFQIFFGLWVSPDQAVWPIHGLLQ
jgi:hypothetical protein